MTVTVRSAILGNVATTQLGARTIERTAIRSDDCAKRIVRLTTSIGEIALRFENGDRLHEGDIIHLDDALAIAVAVEADDVLVFRPTTIASAIALAHALGNRHLPIQRDGDAIVVRYDPLLEALGATTGVAVVRELRVMPDAFVHAHAPHTHA
jgi:urease accessory protein